jgi:hypothetical protein
MQVSYFHRNKSQTTTKEHKEVSWLDENNNNNIFKALIGQFLQEVFQVIFTQ